MLGLEIQTISLGVLLMFAWNSVTVNFSSKNFYADFDNMSIATATEDHLCRVPFIPYGYLGIMEPEK